MNKAGKEGKNHMHLIRRLTPLFIVASALAWLRLSPSAQAVVPKPDGGYGLPLYGAGNTAEGDDALFKLASGGYNTAVGWVSLWSNITGSFNTAVGSATLLANTANENTATGAGALLFNSTGSQNTANGAFALIQNTTGSANTAVGDAALEENTTGTSNTAVGAFALQASNSTFNTAVGVGALMANQFSENTAVGHLALAANTLGGSNTAVGFQALMSEIDGFFNAAFGDDAMESHTHGDRNTAVGVGTLGQLTSGDKNTAIGSDAGSAPATGSGNVYIGADVAGANGETDHTYIRNINTTSVSGGGTDTVTINLSTGLLGHLSSSRRHKEHIQSMNDASETLYLLKPVTYRYKREIDVTQSLDYGLVAEDVATVDPNLVALNKDGQIETVRYTAVNAMLLNEFLKEHKAFVEEQRKVENLQATVAQQQKAIEALTAGLQKVSAQLEVSKSAPQTVLNDN
jgi:Chaperone of endosialidase